MKRSNLNILTLLLCSLLAIGCTEKVSDDVESTGLTDVQKQRQQFNNKYIRVVDKNDSDLSFFLHKAGSLSAPCEIPAPVNGFSAETYDKTNRNFTADCILEVEELDLYFHGASFEIQVDEFLCEYINYKPYRFQRYQSGATSKRVYKVVCDNACGEQDENGTLCGRTFSRYTRNAANDSITEILSDFSFDVTDNEGLQDFCEFDYTTVTRDVGDDEISGPNCDTGQVDVIEVSVNSSLILVGDDLVASCTDGRASTSQRLSIDERHLCGGKPGACIDGAGTEDIVSEKPSLLFNNTELLSFSKSFSYEAPISKLHGTNMYLASFSRICSSTGETKTNAQFDTGLFNIIGHEVEDMPFYNTKEGFSFDLDGDNRSDFTTGAIHPFNTAHNEGIVKPYYAFECLDRAEDVKAQIRLHIREWDRRFLKTNPYIARLSDINQSTPLMDSFGLQAIQEEWNDKLDLDNLFEDIDLENRNGYTPLFLNNQCTSITAGYCTTRTFPLVTLPALADEVSCLAPGACTNSPAITNELDCQNIGERWVHTNQWVIDSYCTNRIYNNENDCETNGAIWVPVFKNTNFPGIGM